MENLKTIHNRVKRILEQKLQKHIIDKKTETRNSDMALYIALAQYLEDENGLNITEKPFRYVLDNLKELGLPTIESVGRARRKVQEQHPHLQSEKKVKKMREVQKEEYRKYTKGII